MIAAFAGALSSPTPAQASSVVDQTIGSIAIQAGGRVKPLDTFARESLQLLYGKTTFNGKSAVEILMTWYLIPESWDKIEFIKISRTDLKQALGLDTQRSLFSPADIQGQMERVRLIMTELEGKRKAQEKLDPYFQAVATLESQFFMFQAVRLGKAWTIVPPSEGTNWISLDAAPEEVQVQFQAIAKGFVAAIKDGDGDALTKAVTTFNDSMRARNPAEYPSSSHISVETHYNRIHPFLISWILYLIATILFVVSAIRTTGWVQKAAWITAGLAFAVHTYGFALRIFLTERPPVTNMYETVVWIPWGALIFGAIVAYSTKRDFALLAATLVNTLCLILADFAPAVLDASIQPLQPVLRSNMWLMIHVLTITLSYAAFFVAFILGDFGMYYVLRGEQRFMSTIKVVANSAYRCVQIGVILLAAGTILGGVWADYSWGRFWGWDPKETWALIALLGYIAVLHGRLAGWLRDVGFLASCVISFSLVIMAWYGVNYVLGAGLHSYGFGGGGVAQVSAFIAAHLLFVTFVLVSRRTTTPTEKLS